MNDLAMRIEPADTLLVTSRTDRDRSKSRSIVAKLEVSSEAHLHVTKFTSALTSPRCFQGRKWKRRMSNPYHSNTL